MSLTLRLIKSRRERRLSQQGLADLIGVSRSALAQWETNISRPHIGNLQKVAEVLDVSFEWLATGRGNQYIKGRNDFVDDKDIDNEIVRLLSRLNSRHKIALLDMIRVIN